MHGRSALSVSIVGLERALIQYCSQPQDEPFDIKTVPIEATPLTEMPRCKFMFIPIVAMVMTHHFYHAAVGEPTPGASVQKTAAASSTQDIYAGKLYWCVPNAQVHVGKNGYIPHNSLSLSLSSFIIPPLSEAHSGPATFTWLCPFFHSQH